MELAANSPTPHVTSAWKEPKEDEGHEIEEFIVLHQSAVHDGNIEMLEDYIISFINAAKLHYGSFYVNPKIGERVHRCLTSFCNIEEEETPAWTLYYISFLWPPNDLVKTILSSIMQLIPRLTKLYHPVLGSLIMRRGFVERKEQKKDEDDELEELIILHQSAVHDGNIEMMQDHITSFINAAKSYYGSFYINPNIGERVHRCLTSFCDIAEEATPAWTLYYISFLWPLNDLVKTIVTSVMELIPRLTKSSRLKCLAYWRLAECYYMLGKFDEISRCSKLQIQVAEHTSMKFLALVNVCHTLNGSPDWILEQLESMRYEDPVCKGLYMYCHGQIAYVMHKLEECSDAFDEAIAIFAKLEPSSTAWVPQHGFQYMETIARKTKQVVQVRLQRFNDLLIELIKEHQDAVASGNDEHIIGADNVWRACCSKDNHMIPKAFSKSFQSRILGNLQANFAMEAEENRAWVSYYHAMALSKDNEDYEQLLKQSLVLGKSSTLRYLASYHLNHLDICKADDRLTYRLQNVEAARATTWIHVQICTLHDLFRTYFGLGQYDKARELQRQIEKYGGPLADGVSLFCLGKISLVIGKYEECVDLFRNAITELEKVEFNAHSIKGYTIAQILCDCICQIVQCQLQLGKVEDGEFEGGMERFEETALRGIPSGSSTHEHYKIIFLRSEASLLLHKSKVEEAKEIWLKLLAISRKDAKHRLELGHEALLNLAKIALISGNTEDIENHFVEAEELGRSYPILLRSVLELEINFYLSSGKYEEAIEKLEALLDMDMKTPGKFDSSIDRISFIDNNKDKFRKMELSIIAKIMFEGQGSGQLQSKALLWPERQRGRDFLHSLENRPGVNYLNNSSIFDENDEVALSELRSISKLAGANTIFILFSQFCSYFIQDGKLPHLGLADQVSPFSKVPEAMKPLTNPEAMKSAISDTGSKIKQKWDQVMRDLFKLLIGCWEEALERAEAKSIVIVTSEETSIVPFAALRCSDGKYLIEKYEISTISFLRLFKHCEMRRQYLTKKREHRRALVVANPKKNLKYAEEEGKIVAKILEEAGLSLQCLTGDEAKVGAVSNTLPNSCWIHISCHTVFNRIPSGSLELARSSELFEMVCKFGALELAEDNQIAKEGCNIRAERAQISKTRRKDLLTAEQICEGEELSAVVTVLGACSSGTGQICAEGTLGLTRAFHLAGVPTVVASLWKVDDQATKALMDKFYVNMKDGWTVAAALRQSMISLKDKYEHPLYWAPFFVSGSPFSSLSDVSQWACHVAT